MPTTTSDFQLSDFDLTAGALTSQTDAYSNSWTLVNPYKSVLPSNYGTILQNPPEEVEGWYDDTALRGDNYVVIPQTAVLSTNYFFEATPIDYDKVRLKWSAGVPLYSTYGAEPVPTEIRINWDTLGEPQTISNGYPVVKVTADQYSTEKEQSDLPEGTWIYYSIFIKYSSTAYRHWYEKVGSVYVQTPTRYGSTDMLWDRIPKHYRIQDGIQYQTPNTPLSELKDAGPLYRLLNVFGWDIDRLRTLIHHQMVTRDPMLATTEALDMMAEELGVPMTSVDLGTERLRNYLNDVGYLRQAKGTLDGVRETITAITGSDVAVRPLTSSILSTFKTEFNSGYSNDDNSIYPLDGSLLGWSFYTTQASAGIHAVTASSVYGIAKTANSNYDFVVAQTKVPAVNQASWYTFFYDVTNRTNASVVGVAFSPTIVSSASVTVDQTTGLVSGLDSKVITTYSPPPDDWFQAPITLGLSGDGTLTQNDMYLYIYMVFGPSGELYFDNLKVLPDDRFPYEVDVYSQRLNLCRDPQFHFGMGTGQFWDYSVTSGTATASVVPGSKTATFSASTNASVTVHTNLAVGLQSTPIPVRVGIPYYFAVTDTNSNILSVSLISSAYGTIATATTPYATEPGNEARKVWELLRAYEPPWLPRNIQDCYLQITLGIPADTSANLFEPILEPMHAGIDYFDGDDINGGWLAGEGTSSGVSDYRWGDAGQHASFSYYTSDYRRTVVTTLRMLDTILPVTQTGDPISYVKFDRIYGYEGTGLP